MGIRFFMRTGVILDRIMIVLFFVTCILIVFMMLLVSLDVVMRYFLDAPLIFVTESISYSLVFITFLSAPWILKIDRHVTIDIVIAQLNPRRKALINIITSLLGAITCLVLAWYSAQLTWHVIQSGERMSTLLALPRAPLFVPIPVSAFLLFIQFLRRSWSYRSYLRGFSERKENS